MQNLITSTYEHALAYAFHQIDNRGLLLDGAKLEETRLQVKAELEANCLYLSQAWGFPVYIGAENNPDPGNKNNTQALNLNTPQKVLDRLKDLGYQVPKIRKKDEETDEYGYEESVNELALQRLLADPSLWPSSVNNANEPIKKLLESRELITFRNRYVNARLYKNQYFCNYNVAATKTGRRGSKKNIFGFGGNAQNFPARGRLSELWKQCIISRPGRIFFFVDQMQAEDWPVQALSENHAALAEMQAGTNRHLKFASLIFGRSVDEIKRGRESGDSQCELEYYLGKKARHANNYKMQPTRLSESLAAEGFTIPVAQCKFILDQVDKADPNVDKVFHKFIEKQIYSSDHRLVTPLGRERQFFGTRSNEKNYKVLNEAYAWIPQSTVGDNTGLAILHLSNCNSYVLQESHDSICQELPDTEEAVIQVWKDTRDAFNREITFHNGIKINIPIEGMLGFNWKDKVKINDKPWDFTEEKVLEAYRKVKELRDAGNAREYIRVG